MDLTKHSPSTKILALTQFGGLTPRTFDLLFAHLADLDAILLAEQDTLAKLTGLPDEATLKISEAFHKLDLAEEMIEKLSAREITVSNCLDRNHPALLTELHDPPPLLFTRGKLPDHKLKTVALAGTSQASAEGIEMTTRLARTFAEASVQIVGAVAPGIATSAHLGARAVEGNSFGVLDCGLDQLVDSELMPLVIDLANYGGVISEYLPQVEPTAETTLDANRLIAGLAQGVVFTEFYHDSTRTLDLLKFCSEIGKLTFVMIDPEHGAFSDDEALTQAVEFGAILLEGYDHIEDIIRSLV